MPCTCLCLQNANTERDLPRSKLRSWNSLTSRKKKQNTKIKQKVPTFLFSLDNWLAFEVSNLCRILRHVSILTAQPTVPSEQWYTDIRMTGLCWSQNGPHWMTKLKLVTFQSLNEVSQKVAESTLQAQSTKLRLTASKGGTALFREKSIWPKHYRP